jgi:AcrR family transcriptional regulator
MVLCISGIQTINCSAKGGSSDENAKSWRRLSIGRPIMIRKPKRVKSTRIRILNAAEELLRLHGPDELTIVAVAQRLEMSHANVYKHFSNKEELQYEVVERWLDEITKPLEKICKADDEPAAPRIRKWMHELVRIRQEKMRTDRGLFRAYLEHPEPERFAEEGHNEEMIQHLTVMLRQGEIRNEWRVSGFDTVARSLMDATTAYHHPYFLTYGPKEELDLDLLLNWFMLGIQGTKIS